MVLTFLKAGMGLKPTTSLLWIKYTYRPLLSDRHLSSKSHRNPKRILNTALGRSKYSRGELKHNERGREKMTAFWKANLLKRERESLERKGSSVPLTNSLLDSICFCYRLDESETSEERGDCAGSILRLRSITLCVANLWAGTFCNKILWPMLQVLCREVGILQV